MKTRNDNAVENRQIRVFVSSTFQDMQEERNYLVTKTFPILRRLAARRDVSFVELDLRWGISEKESENGKVLQLCMDEIKNSRPFFIGILGDRYGWCPMMSELQKNSLIEERYPWVRDYIKKGRSITEMEMQYGALSHALCDKGKIHASFYIKKDSDETNPLLHELKENVRHSLDYPYFEYESPEDLGGKVQEQFELLLEQLFPEGELSELDKERLTQRSFMRSKSIVYIGVKENEAVISDFAEKSDCSKLAVVGASGMGKSALLANWIQNYQCDENTNVIYHFVGVSESEGDTSSVVHHINREICDIYGLNTTRERENELDLDAEAEELTHNLLNLPEGKKLIIVVDALNQLVDYEGSLLNWIPDDMENVKFIVSTLTDDATYEAVKRHGFDIYEIKELDLEHRKVLIEEYFRCYGKKLSSEIVDYIASDPENENTLVLRTLLSELKGFGVHELLEKRIREYVETNSFGEFFQKVMERGEDAFTEQLFRDVVMGIAVSQHGLSESEIMQLADTKPLYWSQLHNAFFDHFTTRKGLISFAHQYIMNAVTSRYKRCEQEYRQRLVDLFTERFDAEDDKNVTRTYLELAYQYYKLNDVVSLHDFIINLPVFVELYLFHQRSLYKYWKYILSDGKYSLEDTLSATTGDMDVYQQINAYSLFGQFCIDNFEDFLTAIASFKKILSLYESKQYKLYEDDVIIAHNYLGLAYSKIGEFDKSICETNIVLDYYERKSADFQNEDLYIASLNNIGFTYIQLQRWDMAITPLEKVYQISVENGQHDCNDALLTVASNLSLSYYKLNEFEKAIQIVDGNIDFAEKLIKKDPIGYAEKIALLYNNKALSLLGLMRIEECLSIFEKAENNFTVLAEHIPEVGQKYLAIINSNLCYCYSLMRRYDESIELGYKAIELYEKVDMSNPEMAHMKCLAYNNIGMSCQAVARFDEAEDAFNNEFPIIRKLVERYPSAYSSTLILLLINSGYLHTTMGKYETADAEYKEALELIKPLVDEYPQVYENNLMLLYNNLANNYYYTDNYEEASKYFHLAIEIAERWMQVTPESTLPFLATAYQNAATVEELNDSVRDLKHSLDIHKQLDEMFPGLYEIDYAMVCCNLGRMICDLTDEKAASVGYVNCEGANRVAYKYYLKALDIYERHSAKYPHAYDDELSSLLDDMSVLEKSFGKHDLAIEHSEKAIEILRCLAEKYPEKYAETLQKNIKWLDKLKKEVSSKGYN